MTLLLLAKTAQTVGKSSMKLLDRDLEIKKWLTAICYDSCYDHWVREEDTAKYEAAAWTGKLETTSTHELVQSSFHTKLVA